MFLRSDRASFRRDERGATAVEFALVAPLLFFALLSIVEIGMLGMMVSGVDNAVFETARRIRTGRADSASSASTFEDQVCARLGAKLTDCRDRLTISVQRYTRFTDANSAVSTPPAGQFNKGGAGDIIVVKANYKWPIMSPFIASGYEHEGPMNIVIAARTAFKNEPFQ